ncbi:MAG: hypothetical protein ABIQ32_05325 [Sphingomicrobium sp.]
MRWITALLLGAIIGFVLPLAFGGPQGAWMEGWTKVGTIAPLEGSPGLLFSVPFAVGTAIIFRIFFNWHRE